MKARNKNLTKEYFTLSFISGLKDEIRTFVQMFKPTSDTEAFFLARMQQATVDVHTKRPKPYPRPFITTTSQFSPSTPSLKPSIPAITSTP